VDSPIVRALEVTGNVTARRQPKLRLALDLKIRGQERFVQIDPLGGDLPHVDD
jgi:hypothetical protein